MRFRLVHPDCGDGTPTRENLHKFMRATLRSVSDHADSWPFSDPVDPQEVPDYYEIIKEPMDLHSIGLRIDAGDYYVTLEVCCVP
jgi:histone acetyltransferase